MKREKAIEQLGHELGRIYHNATLHGKLRAESDFESDMVESELHSRIESEFADLKYTCPLGFKIRQLGKVYQYGRGGRTVAFEGTIKSGGGGIFRVLDIEDLIDVKNESIQYIKELTEAIKELNDYVYAFCNSAPDDCIKYVREEYKEEIESNKRKKRVRYSGVRYE